MADIKNYQNAHHIYTAMAECNAIGTDICPVSGTVAKEFVNRKVSKMHRAIGQLHWLLCLVNHFNNERTVVFSNLIM